MISLLDIKDGILDLIKNMNYKNFEYSIYENHQSESITLEISQRPRLIQFNIWERNALETNVYNPIDGEIDVKVYEEINLLQILEKITKLVEENLN